MTYGISVGQLVAMKPYQRAKSIAALSESSRMRLAHLASLGLRAALRRADEYRAVLEALTMDETESAS